nr:unnamed protein product [Ipomoea batatas]
MAHVSDIKLIRTDTTLDLSQKAEKGDGRFNTSKMQKEVAVNFDYLKIARQVCNMYKENIINLFLCFLVIYCGYIYKK